MDKSGADAVEKELLKTKLLLQQKEAELKQAIADIDNIAYLASHDLKTPINNIISLAHLIKEQYSDIIGDEGAMYINYINESSYYSAAMINGIHSYSKAARLDVDKYDTLDAAAFITEIINELQPTEKCALQYHITLEEMTIATNGVGQILLPILRNAIQYCDKEQCTISISISDDTDHYIFEITDNGEGIAAADYDHAFTLFKRLRNRDKTAHNMGIGLSVARRIAERMKGAITVSSEVGIGSTFTLALPKRGV